MDYRKANHQNGEGKFTFMYEVQDKASVTPYSVNDLVGARTSHVIGSSRMIPLKLDLIRHLPPGYSRARYSK